MQGSNIQILFTRQNASNALYMLNKMANFTAIHYSISCLRRKIGPQQNNTACSEQLIFSITFARLVFFHTAAFIA